MVETALKVEVKKIYGLTLTVERASRMRGIIPLSTSTEALSSKPLSCGSSVPGSG